MRDLDENTISSRYACVDFSKNYGFPSLLSRDPYILSIGPKFDG